MAAFRLYLSHAWTYNERGVAVVACGDGAWAGIDCSRKNLAAVHDGGTESFSLFSSGRELFRTFSVDGGRGWLIVPHARSSFNLLNAGCKGLAKPVQVSLSTRQLNSALALQSTSCTFEYFLLDSAFSLNWRKPRAPMALSCRDGCCVSVVYVAQVWVLVFATLHSRGDHVQ